MTQRPDDAPPGTGPARPDDLFAPPEPPAGREPTVPAGPGTAPEPPPFPVPVAVRYGEPGGGHGAAAQPPGPAHDTHGTADDLPGAAPGPAPAARGDRRPAGARPARRLGAGVVTLALLAGLAGGFAGGRLSDATGGGRPDDAALPTPVGGLGTTARRRRPAPRDPWRHWRPRSCRASCRWRSRPARERPPARASCCAPTGT